MNIIHSTSEKEEMNFTDRIVDLDDIPGSSDNEEEPIKLEYNYLDQFPHMDPSLKNVLRIYKEIAEERIKRSMVKFDDIPEEISKINDQTKNSSQGDLTTKVSKGDDQAKLELIRQNLGSSSLAKEFEREKNDDTQKSEKKSSNNKTQKTSNTGASTILRQGTKKFWSNSQIIPDQFIAADMFMRALVYDQTTVLQDYSYNPNLLNLYKFIKMRIDNNNKLSKEVFIEESSLMSWISSKIFNKPLLDIDFYSIYKQNCEEIMKRDGNFYRAFTDIISVFTKLKDEEDFSKISFLPYSLATAFLHEFNDDIVFKQMEQEKDLNLVVADLVFTVNYPEAGLMKRKYVHVPVFNENAGVIHISLTGAEDLVLDEIKAIRATFDNMDKEIKNKLSLKEESLIAHFITARPDKLVKHSEKALYAELYLNSKKYIEIIRRRCEKNEKFTVEGMAVHLYSTREPCHHCHIFLTDPWENLLNEYKKQLGVNCGILFKKIEKFVSFSIIYDDPDHITNSKTEITEDKNFFLFKNLINWVSPYFLKDIITSKMQENRVMRSFFISFKPKEDTNIKLLVSKCEEVCRKYFNKIDEKDFSDNQTDYSLKKKFKKLLHKNFNFKNIVESYDPDIHQFFYIEESVNIKMMGYAEAFSKTAGIQIFFQTDKKELEEFAEKLVKEGKYFNEPQIFCINRKIDKICTKFYHDYTSLDIVTLMVTYENESPIIYFNCLNEECDGSKCSQILEGIFPFKFALIPAFGLCNNCQKKSKVKGLRKIDIFSRLNKFESENLFYLDTLLIRMKDPLVCGRCGLDTVLRHVNSYREKINNKTFNEEDFKQIKSKFYFKDEKTKEMESKIRGEEDEILYD